ncbi:MAG: TetR/AcrR family transcriptional regulator [Tissierellia bacterium]|nr:TetR/AcrR family transcriptional regulator [Tissierellia bacterium]
MPANFTNEEREQLYIELLEKGYDLLTTYGMKKLKITDIAKSVDIGTGTFYNFFSSKYEFIFKLIQHRKQKSIIRFEELSKKYPGGIPLPEMKEYLIANLKYDNIYRLLSQQDYNTLMSKLDIEESKTDNTAEYGKYIMSRLKTDKKAEDFILFSEMYKIIIIGTSDLTKLNDDLLDESIEKLVASACEILY